jgi:hypothetical protein
VWVVALVPLDDLQVLHLGGVGVRVRVRARARAGQP